MLLIRKINTCLSALMFSTVSIDALRQFEMKIPPRTSCCTAGSHDTPGTDTKQCDLAQKGTNAITGQQNVPQLRVVCATAWVWEADWLAASPPPDSSEPITEGRINGNEDGDHESSKSPTSWFANIETIAVLTVECLIL